LQAVLGNVTPINMRTTSLAFAIAVAFSSSSCRSQQHTLWDHYKPGAVVCHEEVGPDGRVHELYGRFLTEEETAAERIKEQNASGNGAARH
jgi:hypothetical protein